MENKKILAVPYRWRITKTTTSTEKNELKFRSRYFIFCFGWFFFLVMNIKGMMNILVCMKYIKSESSIFFTHEIHCEHWLYIETFIHIFTSYIFNVLFGRGVVHSKSIVYNVENHKCTNQKQQQQQKYTHKTYSTRCAKLKFLLWMVFFLSLSLSFVL